MANTVISTSLTIKKISADTFKGTLHARNKSDLNNMLVFAKLAPDTGSASVDIYVRSKTPIGGELAPLNMPAVLNTDTPGDEFYEMKEYPIRVSDSNAVRVVFEAADLDTAFEVTVVFKTSISSILRIEMPKEA